MPLVMHERRKRCVSYLKMLGRWRKPPVWIFAAIAWLLLYTLQFGLQLDRPPVWAAAFDQSRYIASARAFAQGDLSAASHWYPLPYSLLASPFVWILPHEPFFLIDLALFVATCIAFTSVMRRLGIGATAATVLFVLGDLAVPKYAELWTRPWTTTLSAPLIWTLMAQALHLIDAPADEARPRPRAMLLLGLIAGALPLVRPADGMIALTAVLFTMAMILRQRRLRAAGIGCIVLGGLAIWVPLGLLHLAIYGSRVSDYARAAARQGFAFSDLPWKAYVVLVSAAPWFPNSLSLFEWMPWLVPGVTGLGLAWVYGDRRCRIVLMLIAVLALPYLALVLAYTDLQPPGLWKFKNAHYFKWLFPLGAVGFWLWLQALRTRLGARRATVGLGIVLSPMAVRPLPVAVPDSVAARMLMFRGSTDRDWNAAYFAPATITDTRGSMTNVGRFHQIPDRYGERALAVSRLFAGSAVRDDFEAAAPYRVAQRPYARYAVRLSIGFPCWLRNQSACRVPPPPENLGMKEN